jgi:hypothetical protein
VEGDSKWSFAATSSTTYAAGNFGTNRGPLAELGAWEVAPVVDPSLYKAGAAVCTVGHSLIGPSAKCGATVSFGSITSVKIHPSGPCAEGAVERKDAMQRKHYGESAGRLADKFDHEIPDDVAEGGRKHCRAPATHPYGATLPIDNIGQPSACGGGHAPVNVGLLLTDALIFPGMHAICWCLHVLAFTQP